MDLTTHVPGEAYILTRREFFRFLEEMDGRSYISSSWGEDYLDQRAALWQHIANREAGRVFQEGWDHCSSVFSISTVTNVMEWEYETTRGTLLLAIDNRRQDEKIVFVEEGDLQDDATTRDVDYKLPWNDDFALEIPHFGIYRVVIPAERDQPGRRAWTQVRLAMEPTLAYRCWAEEQNQEDKIGQARLAFIAALNYGRDA